MPKTRLNRDKRDVLHYLAARAVDATPIEPVIEKRVKVAQAAFDRVHDAQVAEARSIIARKVPAADLKVLARYELTKKMSSVVFVDLDSRNQFAVVMFNDNKYNRDHLTGGVASASWEERQKYQADKQKAVDTSEVELPVRSSSQISRFGASTTAIEASAKLIKLASQYKDAGEELGLAERADRDKRENIKRDFVALIEGSRTFEDVVEVWPEAKEVSDQIIGAGRAVSLVSLDAIERIQANMKARNVKA